MAEAKDCHMAGPKSMGGKLGFAPFWETWQKAYGYSEGWGIGVYDTIYQILIFRVIVLLLYNSWTEFLYFAGYFCNEKIESQDHFKNGIIW